MMKRLIFCLIGLSLVQVNSNAAESNNRDVTDHEAASQQNTVEKPTSTTPSNKRRVENRKNITEPSLGMSVSGNKELPNVLYIIPWKSDASSTPLPQVSRLVDEIYAPVDPEVFGKQVNFYYQLVPQDFQETLPDSEEMEDQQNQ